MLDYVKRTRFFVFWGVVCLLANVFCTYAEGYDGDQSFWVGWTQQLVDGGFGNFRGNYPPVYVFWLWVVAHIHSLFGIGIGKTFFLKFMCLWPVYFSHLLLLDGLCRFMDRFLYPEWKRHALAGFIALNPAILIAGPIWGQVDLVPVVFAIAAMYCMCFRRTTKFGPMFYVLSLLAKFQMILFLPVFGGLFLKHWRRSWKGLALIVPAALVVLLPFAIGGNLLDMLSRAYVKTTEQYPYATFNAANLWYLWVGNAVPDTVLVWGFSEQGLGFIFKPGILGKLLFILVSIFTLVKTILSKNVRTVWALAFLNAVAFFAVLPGMHERYLLYAIPVGLCWLVWDSRRAVVWVALATFAAMTNISLIVPFKGPSVWNFASFTACAVLVLTMVSLAFPKVWGKIFELASRVKWRRFVPYVLLLVILLVSMTNLLIRMQPSSAPTGDDIVLLTKMPMDVLKQDYKGPQRNRSVEERPIQVNNRIYRDGIGTHASSRLLFQLPENADSLYIGAAIDDETYSHGDCEFSIRLDGNDVWSSGRVAGGDRAKFTALSVRGFSTLELVTDALGSNTSDHADWLLPYIKLK